jgi:hypothetical protein
VASASPEPTARIAGRSPLSRRSALLLGGPGVAGTAVGGAGLWWSLASRSSSRTAPVSGAELSQSGSKPAQASSGSPGGRPRLWVTTAASRVPLSAYVRAMYSASGLSTALTSPQTCTCTGCMSPRRVPGTTCSSRSIPAPASDTSTGFRSIILPASTGITPTTTERLPTGFSQASLMSASTIVVALNAQLLRRLKLNPAQAR